MKFFQRANLKLEITQFTVGMNGMKKALDTHYTGQWRFIFTCRVEYLHVYLFGHLQYLY